MAIHFPNVISNRRWHLHLPINTTSEDRFIWTQPIPTTEVCLETLEVCFYFVISRSSAIFTRYGVLANTAFDDLLNSSETRNSQKVKRQQSGRFMIRLVTTSRIALCLEM